MSNWDAAEAWRRRGLRVFPIHAATQKPCISGYQFEASNDPDTIREWWVRWPDANVGVALGGGVHVLDVDVKKGKPGLHSFFELGLFFDTLTVRTPSGGFHVYYFDTDDFANGVEVLPGLDIKSAGGMALCPGSYFDGGFYTVECELPIAPLPPALKVHLRPPSERRAAESLIETDHKRNIEDALTYLRNVPPAIEGMGGNSHTYAVAAALTHDYALSEATTFQLMLEHFNPRCMPPWEDDDLEKIIAHAEAYARGDRGTKTSLHMFGGIVPLAQAPLPAVPQGDPFPELGNFGNYLERDKRPPKRWVIRNFIQQGNIQALIAPGGVGKSTISLLLAAHIAQGLPIAPGWEVKQKGRVIVVNLEDSRAFMSEKLEALCFEYKMDLYKTVRDINLVTREDFPFKVTVDGAFNEAHVKPLVEKASQEDVVAIIVDPLVLIHDVSEQDNISMAAVITCLKQIAVQADVGLLFIHNTGKSGIHRQLEPGNEEMSRGAKAITDNTRHVLTLVPLPKAEADEHGLDEHERRLFTRLDIAKSNIAANDKPPLYFKRCDVRQMDGETTPVFRVHTWDEKSNDDADLIGRLIFDIMGDKNGGSVLQTELVDRWRAEDAIRDKMGKEAVTEALGSLYRLKGYFGHKDDEGRVFQFFRSKEGKHIVFSMNR